MIDSSSIYSLDKSTQAFKEYQNGECSFEKNYDSEIYETEDNENENEYILLCPCCSNPPKIKFINKQNLNIKCENGWNELKVKDCIEKYLKIKNIEMIHEEKINNLYCKLHYNKSNKGNKYELYCLNCKYNLCEDCNFIKTCEKHDKRKLFLDETKREYLIKHIKIKRKIIDNETEKNFCILLDLLLYTNLNFPNINTLKSLENSYNLIINADENKEIKIKIKKGKFINNIQDLTRKKLLENKRIYENYDNVYKINFNKSNFRKLRTLSNIIIKTFNRTSLIKLVLAGNNINSIKCLAIASEKKHDFLINLRLLDLARNNLGNKNITYLERLNCKKLVQLYLHQNRFSDYDIFNIISKNFNSELEIFYIGFNKFEINIDKLRMNLPILKEIYLDNNRLTEIDFEKLIDIYNLERLYVNYNKIKKIINFDKIQKLNKFRYVSIGYNKFDELKKNEIINEAKNMEKFEISF